MANSPHRYNGTGVHTVKIYPDNSKKEKEEESKRIIKRVPKEEVSDYLINKSIDKKNAAARAKKNAAKLKRRRK